jgi:hypothetical protein
MGFAASWACFSFKCQTDRSDPIASPSIKNINKIDGKVNCHQCTEKAIKLVCGGVAEAACDAKGVLLQDWEERTGWILSNWMKPTQLSEAIAGLPNGSRGVVAAFRRHMKNGVNSHLFIYVKNSHGAVTYIDGQCGVATKNLPVESFEFFSFSQVTVVSHDN